MLLLLLVLGCRVEPPDDIKAFPDTAIDTAFDSASDTAIDSGEPPCEETAWYHDADGDTYGSAAVVMLCEAPPGYVATSGDCDDNDAATHPGAAITCTSDDANCDGSPDNADADGDHFLACEECDDLNAASFPGATETCDGADNDCDGAIDDDAVDMGTWYLDGDGDGQGGGTVVESCEVPAGAVDNDRDCDDADASVYVGADERCNDIDDDCDGAIDEDAVDAPTWNIDYDGDGFGSSAYVDVACEAAAGWVADATDCDDAEGAVNPAATETCNGVDDNCDGAIDEDSAADAATWYADTDGDGEGDATVTTAACAEPAGYVAWDTDCDDADASVYSAAIETCDGLDENCDGVADNGALGGDVTCAAASCLAILEDGSSTGDGLYWLDPDEDGDTTDAWQAWCDMTTDGGGWTRLYGSLWPYWWDELDWEWVGGATDDNYSALAERDWFADSSGTYTLRLEVGQAATWNTGSRSNYTVWQQAHDAFSDTTDGSDYVYIAGDESTTCSGFNGLHDQYYLSAGTHCMVSDVDSGDSVGCWWMQILPLAQYVDATSYPGYLEGYDGPSTHLWQSLSVR
jgi:hypothetical protein